jgi:TM2 domain-containing membrane protein YozV
MKHPEYDPWSAGGGFSGFRATPPPYAGAGHGVTPCGYPYHPESALSYGDPSAPFGRDPVSGEPLSDKCKVTAGLLQIFLGWLGAGRFYMGSNAIAVAQLLTWVVGFFGLFIIVGAFVWMALGVWIFIDGLMLLIGNPRDGRGRLMR